MSIHDVLLLTYDCKNRPTTNRAGRKAVSDKNTSDILRVLFLYRPLPAQAVTPVASHQSAVVVPASITGAALGAALEEEAPPAVIPPPAGSCPLQSIMAVFMMG